MVVLLGLCLGVVLTMIAGARELLTPGAWQQQGLLYKLRRLAARAGQAGRSESCWPGVGSIWRICKRRCGAMPTSTRAGSPRATLSPEIEPALWELPGVAEMRYLYVPGLKIGQPLRVLAFEPDVYGGDRLVLRTDGKIVCSLDGRTSQTVAGEAAMKRILKIVGGVLAAIFLC